MIKITQYVKPDALFGHHHLINDGPDKNRGGRAGTPEISVLYLLLIHFITINLFRVYCEEYRPKKI